MKLSCKETKILTASKNSKNNKQNDVLRMQFKREMRPLTGDEMSHGKDKTSSQATQKDFV